eukprot:s2957_g12.t1
MDQHLVARLQALQRVVVFRQLVRFALIANDDVGDQLETHSSATAHWRARLRLCRECMRDLGQDVKSPDEIAAGTAGAHLPAPDVSGSTASSRSQWALPGLKRELQIPVGTAGPQPRAPDPSGQRQNRELQISVGTAGPQPRAPDPSGQCRTSTAG